MTTYGRSNYGANLLVSTTGSTSGFTTVGEISGFQPPEISQDLIDVAKMDGDGWSSKIPSGKKTLGDFEVDLNWVDDASSSAAGTMHKQLMDAASSNGGTQWFKITLPLAVGGSITVPSMVFKGFVNKFNLSKIDGLKPDMLTATIGISPDGAPTFTNF